MANHVRPIAVSAADRAELERLHRASSTPVGLSRRARAVLLMSQGLSGVDVAERIGYTVVQVSRIRRRFAEGGLAGLRDRPKSGRPPTVSARKRAQIVALTLKPPAPGVTHWTTRDLARKTGVSHSTVHRLWQGHALKPHRLTTFKFTTDPQAEDKIHDVVGLYLNPPTNAVVLSLDEKTQIQALSRTQPRLPLRPGLPARQTHDSRRNGLTSLYAALEVATGTVLGECRARHTGADFLAFLKRLTRGYPGQVLHVILDNSSTHTTPAVQAWRATHPQVHFHFTPTGASWLNLVEAWFSILTRKSVRRGSFDTVRVLIRHIERYLSEWNTHPTPFVWTKEPADIIKKALRRSR
jgi:transposase